MQTEPIRQLILESKTATSMDRLSQILVELSSWFATLGQELEDILVFKADRWMELRGELKSDKSADRKWDSEPLGKNEIRLRSQLKYLEKVISAIKMRLRIKEGESYGKY